MKTGTELMIEATSVTRGEAMVRELRARARQRAALALFSVLRPEDCVEWQAADAIERLVREGWQPPSAKS